MVHNSILVYALVSAATDSISPGSLLTLEMNEPWDPDKLNRVYTD